MAVMPLSPFLHPFARPAKDDFLTIVRGEGAMVYDADGNAYVDSMASLWYSNIGHGRGEMADAVARQMRTLEAYSCFDPFTNPPAEELAELLATWSPLPATRVFFTAGVRGGGLGHQARPHRPGPGRPARAKLIVCAALRLPRRDLRRHDRRRACPRTRPASVPCCPTSSTCPATTWRPWPTCCRAGRPDRRRHHRAGPGRRRASARRPATWTACAGCATSTAPTSSSTR